jgi:hypothetical protein
MPLATIYQFNSGRQFIGGAVLHIYSYSFVGVKVSADKRVAKHGRIILISS